MAFSLDQSLTHLEIKEPDLAELYRSSNSAVPPEEQCQGHLCEAYVCTSREEGRFSAYIAFFDTTTQRPVILSSACDSRKPADQKRLVNEALKLTKSMGFDMEPVKLNYSAAMRQVIIRGKSGKIRGHNTNYCTYPKAKLVLKPYYVPVFLMSPYFSLVSTYHFIQCLLCVRN